MWSIGNEVPTQCEPAGSKVAEFLQGIIHREDPTRPVTCGMDRVDCVLNNGFAAVLDVPGLNYRTGVYQQAYESLPQKVVLGTETASTVSSRGVYKFPVEQRAAAIHDDHQSSSYDVEYCPWSNIPDADFALAEDFPWTMGQFVWTGFDYLGSPRRMIRMPGPATAPCSESSIWLLFPKTVTICIGASGTGMNRRFMFCRTGHGPDGRARKLRYSYTVLIRRWNCSSTEFRRA